jgi:hypothetical protein
MSHNLRETLRIVNPQKSRYFRGKILEWHKSNKRSFPWRKTKNSYYTQETRNSLKVKCQQVYRQTGFGL